MAKTGNRQKRRRNRRRDSVGLSRGFAIGVLLLLGSGLLAWNYRSTLTSALHMEPDSRHEDAATETTPAPKKGGKPASKAGTEQESTAPEAATRFEFYDMLPDAEVDVADQPPRPRAVAPPLISVPGTYVVQAGAFPDFAAADKVKARLALLGIVSEIQVAESSGTRFHRVRIGPIENLDELNRLRARLRQNGIEHQVIPIGE